MPCSQHTDDAGLVVKDDALNQSGDFFGRIASARKNIDGRNLVGMVAKTAAGTAGTADWCGAAEPPAPVRRCHSCLYCSCRLHSLQP